MTYKLCAKTAFFTVVFAFANPQFSQAESMNSQELQQFCSSISDPISDARALLQKEKLESLAAELDEQIVLIEQKRAELEKWVLMREKFAKAASENLVNVFSNMRADAAAIRMEEMPIGLTSALIGKLKPRQSAAILNEMSVESAAAVAQVMSASANTMIDGDVDE